MVEMLPPPATGDTLRARRGVEWFVDAGGEAGRMFGFLLDEAAVDGVVVVVGGSADAPVCAVAVFGLIVIAIVGVP